MSLFSRSGAAVTGQGSDIARVEASNANLITTRVAGKSGLRQGRALTAMVGLVMGLTAEIAAVTAAESTEVPKLAFETAQVVSGAPKEGLPVGFTLPTGQYAEIKQAERPNFTVASTSPSPSPGGNGTSST